MLDERSERNISTLHPKVQDTARRFVVAANEQVRDRGFRVVVISGNRTYAQQNELYAQGRTKPGRKVTNARGGYSNHNFGLAWDIGIFKGPTYIPESPLYRELGAVGKGMDLEWGGDWKSFVDEPHYQFKTGLTLAQLRAKVANGEQIL